MSLATDGMADLRELTFPNKRAYCDRHGYAFIGETATLDASRPPSWSKVPLLLRHLPDFDWLMWSDADAVFTNLDRRLDDLIATDADLVIAKDLIGINAGSFLIRNTLAAAGFLRRVWDQRQFINHCWWEQAAMMHLINGGTAGISVQYPAKAAINSYPEDWRPGDLVLHVPGRNGKLELLCAKVSERVPQSL